MKSFTVSCRASHLPAACRMTVLRRLRSRCGRDRKQVGASTAQSDAPAAGWMMTPDHCVDEEGTLELPLRSIDIGVI